MAGLVIPRELKRFIKDTSWAFISLAVASGVHFLLRIFLARYYGVGDLGLYSLAFTVYSFGLVFTAFGVDAGIVKYVAQYSGDSTRTKIFITSGTVIAAIIGCTLGLIFFLLSPILANYFFKMPDLTIMLRIVSCSFPFIALEKVAMGFLNAKRQMRSYALINIIQNILVAILTLFFAITGHEIYYAVIGLVLPLVIMCVVSLLCVIKSISWKTLISHNESVFLVKTLLTFGFYVILSAGVGVVQSYTATTLLGYFKTDVDVGLFSVVQTVLPILTLPSSAIQTITNPMIASYWGKHEISNIESLVNRSMKSMALYSMAAAFILGLLSEEIITFLFGKDFGSASVPLKIMLFSGVLSAMQGSVGGALSSTNYVKLIFRITGITVILNIILNLILDPSLGINGAAIATSVSMSIASLINLYFTQRMIKIKIETVWFVKFFVFTLILGGVSYFIGEILNPYIATILALVILAIISIRFFITREQHTQMMNFLRPR